MSRRYDPKRNYEEYSQLIDWKRDAQEEIKTRRFCPHCGEYIQLVLKEHKYFQNFYGCPVCGETIFTRVTYTFLSNKGHISEEYRKK